ncbi:hypothetical protein BS50DRAFT_570478 [Corynespora cassiicola Philippines]|uniref:Uncharacterized protein n=1 Tax=Corynespora cassiicola Philippines TaxID=1448308 RepID=A0A2T2P144_CORCC|nr:hypothetical protein BS50DRAFT_570478 [Corynespora cassiicola Philippines]
MIVRRSTLAACGWNAAPARLLGEARLQGMLKDDVCATRNEANIAKETMAPYSSLKTPAVLHGELAETTRFGTATSPAQCNRRSAY